MNNVLGVCVCVVCGCLIYQYIVTDYGAHAEPHQASVFLSFLGCDTNLVCMCETNQKPGVF
jgi:hypothetical protein